MGETPNIEVLVVEDHPLTQAGMRSFLAAFPDLTLMGFVESGESAMLYCEQNEPDVILMDLMPKMGGVRVIREIKSRHPSIKIVVLTYLEEPGVVDEVMQAGASSCMLKTSSAYELADSIRMAAKQERATPLDWRDQAAYPDFPYGA